MSSVEGGQRTDLQALGRGHDRCIYGAEGKVLVGMDKFRDAEPVRGTYRFSEKVAGSEITKEADFSARAQPRFEQVDDLGHHEDRHQERARVVLQQPEAFAMVTVVCVDIGIERTGVDEQGYRVTSARRISSIRSDTSAVPLRPAPAPIKRRCPLRAPRCSSMAFLVNSETVVDRRSAS
jgi:hypothetical protein